MGVFEGLVRGDEVFFFYFVGGVHEALGEVSIVGEDEEAFALTVEPADVVKVVEGAGEEIVDGVTLAFIGAGADESVTAGPEAVKSGKAPAGEVAPAMMTPAAARKVARFSVSGKDAWARFPGHERWLSPGSKKKELAIERAHRSEIARALEAGEPVSAAAVAAYHIKLPEGYEKAGDLYVSISDHELSKTQPIAPSMAITRVRTEAPKRRMAA